MQVEVLPGCMWVVQVIPYHALHRQGREVGVRDSPFLEENDFPFGGVMRKSCWILWFSM